MNQGVDILSLVFCPGNKPSSPDAKKMSFLLLFSQDVPQTCINSQHANGLEHWEVASHHFGLFASPQPGSEGILRPCVVEGAPFGGAGAWNFGTGTKQATPQLAVQMCQFFAAKEKTEEE